MGDYSSELQPKIKTSGENKSRWMKWAFIALLVLCLVLLLILILTLALKLNCSERDSDGESAEGDKKKGHEEPVEALKFLYMSDFHMDPLYKANVSGKTKCREEINATAADYEAPYGRIGCDTPRSLVEMTLKAMKYMALEDDATFFMFTGDMAAHGLWKPDGDPVEVLKTMFLASDLIHETFPEMPVFPVFGNNDLPGHYVLPNETSTWYNSLLEKWAPLILCSDCPNNVPRPTDMETLKATFLKGGYYNVSIAGGRGVLLALNTMYFNLWSAKGEYIHGLAGGQMDWLEEQLRLAKSRGQKVIIGSHIPPGIDPYGGSSFWWNNYTESYVKLVAEQYSDVIAGQFYGHIHKDDFHLQLTPNGKAFALLAPSISPVYNNNPAFRIVSFDKQGSLVDYRQYYMDLVMATEFSNPVLQFDYFFSNKYPSANKFLDAERIYELNEQLINQTSNGFWDEYIRSRQTHYQPEPYSRFQLYCAMREVLQEGYQKCLSGYKVPGG